MSRLYQFLMVSVPVFLLASPFKGQQTSISDNISYITSCQKAVDDSAAFSNFKRDAHYNVILEHVNYEQGLAYIEATIKQTPDIFKLSDAFRENDVLGNPITFSYGELGTFSPTTLRYIKVASDLILLYGDSLDQSSIIEIGGGYGGQCFILSKIFPFKKYTIVDIPSALALTKKYLDALQVKNVVYRTHEESIPEEEFDLVISNFAYTECITEMQEKYDREILAHSKRGYMTCIDYDAPKEAFLRRLNQMGIPYVAIPEYPRTGSTPFGDPNYLLTWGDHKHPIFDLAKQQ